MEAELTSREIYRRRIDSAIGFINAHLSDDLSLAPIAQAAGFSPFHFHRIFTAIVGETPHDFVNRVRLERAANFLVKAPSRTITEVAFACGFSSSASFARAFKQHFGVTASDYSKDPPPLTEDTGRSGPTPPEPALVARVCNAVEVRAMPRFHVAYVSNLQGYSLPAICRAWGKLYKWAAARDLITPQATMIGISFDDPLITPQQKCRYYACLTVPEAMTFDATVGLMEIPAGKCAVCHLPCAAEEIEAAYHILYGEWLPGSGYQPADRPCYEIYHATPETNDSAFVLEICIPVRPL